MHSRNSVYLLAAVALFTLGFLAGRPPSSEGGGGKPAVPAVVEAQKFVLKDAAGNVRAEISTSAVLGATASLVLYDKDKAMPLTLSTGAGAPFIAMKNKDRSQVLISTNPGMVGMHVVGSDGKRRLSATLEPTGPSVKTFDAAGKVTGTLPAK